jgi:hypothetical protein
VGIRKYGASSPAISGLYQAWFGDRGYRDLSMRGFIFLAILIGIGLTMDAFVYEGRYRRQAWNDASYQAEKANSEVQYWIRKLGP